MNSSAHQMILQVVPIFIYTAFTGLVHPYYDLRIVILIYNKNSLSHLMSIW